MSRRILMCILALLPCIKSALYTENSPSNPLHINIIPFWDVMTRTCELQAAPRCKNSRYRTYDGTCNNLLKPVRGAAERPYARLVRNNYADGISKFPHSRSGHSLPNAREISDILFPFKPYNDTIWTLITMQFGQIVTHEMSFLSIERLQKNTTCTCCDGGKLNRRSSSVTCAPITLPANDLIRKSAGAECMGFSRTTTTKDKGCTSFLGSAAPITSVTSFLDASIVYGNSEKQALALRLLKGGKLRTEFRNGQEWPPNTPDCQNNSICYMTGDSRVSQNPQLTILQIVLLREHNRLADSLAILNPNWNDETLFQEARRILIATLQHIVYYEYLPILIGYDFMIMHKLIYNNTEGYINDYDSTVDPSILVEHATAALRHFHTMIQGYLGLFDELRNQLGSVRLSDWLNKPSGLIEQFYNFANLVTGLSTQQPSASDQFWSPEVHDFLFRGNKPFGVDLRATDIQRSRDHGVAPYVKVRAACNLPVPKSFEDLSDYISEANISKLKSLYEKIEDVDLIVAGSLEHLVPGTLIGPTFQCILTKQFYRTRVGDRYFYENGADPVTVFTPGQLQSIRKGASMARLLCDNTGGVYQMQRKAFELVSDENPLQFCEELPAVDLDYWKDKKSS